jgi:iron complex transport system ATP-binding protein
LSIEVSGVSFSYGERLILDNIDVTAGEGQLLSVVGPNGVGKSTLFHCMLGLLNGFEGQIKIDGYDTRKLGIKEMAELVAYIPQSHYPSFNFSVFDMVLMGTSSQVSSISMPGGKQSALVEAALERLGITHLRNRGYTQISGGERQLVLIARALVQQTRILILDEPTANLDFGNQIRVLTQIQSLARAGYTIIQSTHNPEQTFMFSDTVLALHNGRVLASGAPSDILTGELVRKLYGVDIEVQSLYQDRVRVCIPSVVVENNDRNPVIDNESVR